MIENNQNNMPWLQQITPIIPLGIISRNNYNNWEKWEMLQVGARLSSFRIIPKKNNWNSSL